MNSEDTTTERSLEESEETSREILRSGNTLKQIESNEGPLTDAEQSVRLHYDNAPLGFQCLDEIGHLILVNREWLSLTGYSREQVVGNWFGNYLVPSQRDTFREQLKSIRLHGQVRGTEYELIRQDGSKLDVSFSAGLVHDVTSSSTYVYCMLGDITEKKRLEDSIERAKREWEQMIDSVPDMVAIIGMDHRIVRLNKPMAARLGLDVREAVGRVCYEVMHGTNAPPDFCPHQKLREDGKEHAAEFAEPRIGATFMLTASPMHNEQGELIACAHVARDITERKLAEEALKEAKAELETRVRERTAELYAANKMLEEKIQTIDQLYEHLLQSAKAKAIAEYTAEVAHELRQPLTIIGGFARRLASQPKLGDETSEAVFDESPQIIVKEVQRLEKILNRLIDFTKRDDVGLQNIDPNELIEYIVHINSERIREKHLTLTLDLDRNVGTMMLDPDRFQHVVRNLLANAIDASPPGEAIRVATSVTKPSEMARETGGLEAEVYFELKIHNYGKEIPSDELEEIFNPFFTTKVSGTGLGLTLARKIVEEHNGSISVKSDKSGTLFTVWLPMSQVPET
ncbi:MAG: PAS domain S-box protein [Desulfomonilaceae bacterium]